MKSARRNKPQEIQAAFDDLFNSFTEKDLLEHEGRMIGFAFLSEVERVLAERAMTKKNLAKLMKTTPSFITQLFTGDKPLSDKHKAKLQRALGIRFVIAAKDEAAYRNEPEFTFPEVDHTPILRIVKDFEPDYAHNGLKGPDYNEDIAA